MDYPYPELTPLLQFYCDVDEHRKLLTQKAHSSTNRYYGSDKPHFVRYQEILPNYLYARCPICGIECRQKIDTYQRKGFFGDRMKYELSRLSMLPDNFLDDAPCKHFLGLQAFFNHHAKSHKNNGFLDLFFNSTGSTPFIAYPAIPDVFKSYAVFHALPICEIESDQFVPMYTTFIITYFNEDPWRVIKHHYENEAKYYWSDSEYYPADLPEGETELNSHKSGKTEDFATLASDGILGYLDFSHPDELPLVIGKGTQWPEIYQHIPKRKLTSLGYFFEQIGLIKSP